MMNLDDLRQFAAVARLGSYSKAAQESGVARSTLSRVVQRLEVELDTTLLHRTTRRVALTSAGAAFLERVAPALLDLEQAVDQLQSQRGEPAGVLRVSTTSDVAVSVLAPVIAELVHAYPKLRIDTRLTLRPVDLVGERVDVALRAYREAPQDSELLGVRLGVLSFGWYGAPSYLAERGVPQSPKELDRHALVTAPGSYPSWRVGIDDSLFSLAVVRAGAGLGILPEPLCAEDLARGSLLRVLPQLALFSSQLWMVYPEGAKSPKLKVFREAVLRRVAGGAPLAQAP